MASSGNYEGKVSKRRDEDFGDSSAGGKALTAEERVERLLEYCNDKSWNDSMEEFMNNNCIVFEGYNRGDEHTLEQTEIYNKFLELFDRKLTDYMNTTGYSRRDIFADFRKVEIENPNSFTATAIQFVLAVVEFEVFVDIMVDTWKANESARESKLSSS